MPIPLRRFYAQKLIDAKNKEAEIIEDARRQAKSKQT
jgi:F0F1-type ATP synthase membrane subunit b/b'|tara:strand:+ start:759 stop:869 length:111 start_codon:yes stop_codon:yes gene_type:complete